MIIWPVHVCLICVWRKVKRSQDSKFNISNITQAIHKMLQNLYLLCCEIMCEILSRLILYFWLVAKKRLHPQNSILLALEAYTIKY